MTQVKKRSTASRGENFPGWSENDRPSRKGSGSNRSRTRSGKWADNTAPVKRTKSLTSKKACKPIAVASLPEGAVVYTRVYFEDYSDFKVRRCIVIEKSREELTLFPVYSIWRPTFRGHEVSDMYEAGLVRPSFFKPVPIVIDPREVCDVAGYLSPRDRQALERVISKSAR